MAYFTPSKKDYTDFNGGVEFVDGDGIPTETLNNIISALLYAQNNSGGGASIDLTEIDTLIGGGV
jgi:hypothetical protein